MVPKTVQYTASALLAPNSKLLVIQKNCQVKRLTIFVHIKMI